MTHVHLDNRKIELITNLEKCPKLVNIYLQDNLIYTLVNEPFKGLKNVVQLSLYDNKIDRMEGFIDCVNLRKLYLEKNMISKLDGLDNCRRLEELYLGHQNLPLDASFEFDEYSLAAISNTLHLLDMPECQVQMVKPLYYLEHVQTLNLLNNRIDDFENEVCPFLQTMNLLSILQLKGNPVINIPKYRD